MQPAEDLRSESGFVDQALMLFCLKLFRVARGLSQPQGETSPGSNMTSSFPVSFSCTLRTTRSRWLEFAT